MREWLSGGAPPCQGGGRGFDPRLALFLLESQASIYAGLRLFAFYDACVPLSPFIFPRELSIIWFVFAFPLLSRM